MTEPLPRLVPVILSGGIGARLWPASRRSTPKQLLPLVGDRPMIIETVDRAAGLDAAAAPIIVTNALHVAAIEHQLAAGGYAEGLTIIEPVGRNTAPAVAVAAHEAMRDGDDPLLFVLPSDHTITDRGAFERAAVIAAEAASLGNLVTFGIEPSHPETGYGYLKVGEMVGEGVHRVDAFREKPDIDTARSYLESGHYLWNSGMFMFRSSVYLAELERHAPEMAALSRRASDEAIRTGTRVELAAGAFGMIDGDSIDYAVMERTDAAAVVPADPGWNDVGSWTSLWDIADRDEAENALTGDVIAIGTTGSFVRADSRLVALVGIDDVVVVDTPDAVLVTTRDQAQEVKQVVDILEASARSEFLSDGSTVHEWGTERIEAEGTGYRVRHVSLDPNATTPIYTETDSSTRWFVVAGSAEVVKGDHASVFAAGESFDTTSEEPYALANPGGTTLELTGVTVAESI